MLRRLFLDRQVDIVAYGEKVKEGFAQSAKALAWETLTVPVCVKRAKTREYLGLWH